MPDSLIDFTNIKNPWTQSSSKSGLPQGIQDSLTGSINSLSGNIPSWNQSLVSASALPGKIDAWTDERIKHQRIGADDWMNSLSAVARQRTGQGILGGTESNNLRAGVLSRLISDLTGRQDAIRAQGNQAKLSVGMGLPGLYAQSAQGMGGLAGLMRSSESQAYQEDPSAWGNIIAKLLIAGYTG